MQLKPGTFLQGDKYRIIRMLGSGGFGITYLAEHVMAKHKVCIKEFFPKEYYNRDEDSCSAKLGSEGSAEMMNIYKAKFIKEAQIIASLNHPNIIHIHDVFTENNTAYYVMEYIAGESLKDVVKLRGALPEAEAVKYIRAVSKAVEYIHERRIMHLDIKPANVMLRAEDDCPILIDFGISKHYDENSGEATSKTPVGKSRGFTPMEQYKEGGVNTFSPETDIYSLGATLYYLVTGTIPPQASDVLEDGLPALPSHLSAGVRRAITTAMQSRRKDRPHSIAKFLGLLDFVDNASEMDTYSECTIPDAVASEAIVADIKKPQPEPKRNEPKPQPEPKHPEGKSNKWWLWLLLTALIIGGIAMFQHDDTNESPALQQESPILDETDGYDVDSLVRVDSLYLSADEPERTEITQPIEDSDTSSTVVTQSDSDTSSTVVTQSEDKHDSTTPAIPIQDKAKPASKQSDNEIWYTNGSTTETTTPYKTDVFGANIVSNTYDAEKKCWVIKFDGKVTTIGELAFNDCTSLTSVTIPDSVTTIGGAAFADCTSLTSVTIPDSVTTIGGAAFAHCTSLTNVTIPDSVTTIGEDAFRRCTSLTSVTIGNSVTTIGKWAFDDCTSLTSVTIGDSVTTIENTTFLDCSSLKEFKGKFAADSGRCLIKDNTIIAYANASGTTYVIPDSVTTIGIGAFWGCTSITSVTIPDSVVSIGNGAFFECTSLTSVTIPDSVTTIGKAAFQDCSSLTSVTIPDSVTKIGDWAFGKCSSLTSVYCKATTPPTGDRYMFYGNATDRKIYVPRQSVEAYKKAYGWKEYADDIVGYDFEN